MVKRIGTIQRKTRYKFKRSIRERGKVPLSRYFQEFKEGEYVNLKLNSNIVKGKFHPRFHGLNGVIVGRKGSCYQVQFKDGNKEKKVYIHPIHLLKQLESKNLI